ncbi:hypothetical protein GCM10023220_38070 [Streptomyces ziwulingensis]|uniref:Carrier domain-containing protein n=1 Tax=Streptomyces ziwulingensis TaxID=1045501 RepID=A0ABP9C483_9ACTN
MGLDSLTWVRRLDAHQGTGQQPEAAMVLQFIGIDPDTAQSGSPTAWVDLDNSDIVLQSYTADDRTRTECGENTAPGHDRGIPAHETVIRVPVHLVPLLREACDAAERRAALQRPARSRAALSGASGDARRVRRR